MGLWRTVVWRRRWRWKKLWPGEESRASTAAARVTWPSCLLLADWSVLAGNKNINFLTFSKFTFSAATRLNCTLKRVFAEIVCPRRRRFAYTGLWGMSFEFFFLLSCSPASNVGMGLCSAPRPFSLHFTQLCFVRWLARCQHVEDEPDVTATIVR